MSWPIWIMVIDPDNDTDFAVNGCRFLSFSHISLICWAKSAVPITSPVGFWRGQECLRDVFKLLRT